MKNEMIHCFGNLSFALMAPILGALVIMMLPREFPKLARAVALLASGASGLILFCLFFNCGFNANISQFQWQEFVSWIPSLGINYHLGVDGVSIWLLLLTAVLSLFAIGIGLYVKERVHTFMVSLLVLQTAIMGAFVSLNLILFYTFFELSLVPIFFLINLFGTGDRVRASLKFFIYTFGGSLLMLVGMITVAILQKKTTGVLSFDLLDLQKTVSSGKLWSGLAHLQDWVFWAFAVAFMIKSPMFPFHTWQPKAYQSSPTSLLVLSAVILKMGSYGFLRFCFPLFPESVSHFALILVILSVIGILYGALLACTQKDIKGIMAYSSLSHMGFILLGIFSLTSKGLVGATFQQFNHGLTTGLLFLLLGYLIERKGTSELSAFGGLKSRMPVLTGLVFVAVLASVGLPGTSGFIGEFLILLGTFEACFHGLWGLPIWISVAAGLGVVLSAIYMLRLYGGIFFGNVRDALDMRLREIKPFEVLMGTIAVFFILWGGIYPKTFTALIERSIENLKFMATMPPGKRPVWSHVVLKQASPLNFDHECCNEEDFVWSEEEAQNW